MNHTMVTCFILVMLLTTSSCTSSKQDVFTVSSQEDILKGVPKADRAEVRTGYQVYLSLVSQADIVTEPSLVTPVETIGRRLIRHAKRRKLPYHFTIIRDPRIYASSTPGGFIYITTGMLSFVKYEAELAAVLAHEIGQTQYREIEYTRRKHLMNMLQSLSSYTPYVLGPAGIAAPKGVKFVNNVLLHDAFPVAAVMDADALGVEYLQKEGFAVMAWYDVLKRITSADASTFVLLTDYQRIRPITEERIKRLKECIRKERATS